MPELDPSADIKRGRTKIAATIFVAHAIKHLYNSGQGSLIMPEIKISLGLSRAQFGSLATSSSIAWWTSTMVAGYLGDRFSNRTGMMLAVAMSLMGGAFYLLGIAPNYKTMLVVMFLAGIGPSLFHPPALGELSRRFPDRRGFAVSLHGMGANIGEVLGAPAVAGLLTFMMWRDVLKISLGPALLVAAAVWLLMPSRKGVVEDATSSSQGYFASLASLMRNRVLLLLIVATALRSIGEGGVGAFLSLYMRENLEYSVTTVALFLSVAQVAGIVSQPIMGILSDRIGRKPVLVTGTGLVMLSAFALAVAKPGIQLFLAVMVRGAFSFSLHHIFVAAALDAARGVAQSTVVSLIYGAGFLGTFSPFIAGLISDKYGIHSAFVYGGVTLIFPTVLLAVARFGGTEVDAPTKSE
jgi:FSR family fosmidomycin resistance protein-like MFS transporter